MNIKIAIEYLKSKEYMDRLQERAFRLQEAEHDLDKRDELIKDCANDPILFIETFGWTKLTDLNDRTVPFFLWGYQKEVIWKLQEAEADIEKEHEILIDKPRKMGLTWVLVWYLIWRWIFKKGWSGFILSRTETEVDSGDNDPGSSIFGKIRWCFERIPSWIMPAGYKPKSGQRGTQTDKNLKISNPDIGSALVGSTTNSNAGRSRRYSLTFVDEAFAIEGFNSMYRSIQSVSRVKVFVSTSRVGSVFKKFKDVCEAAGDYITLNWRQHPWNDDEWFKEMEKRAEVDPEVMKEVMVDYNVNIQAQYYPEVKDSKVLPVHYNPQLPIFVFMDYGSKDLTVFGWMQFDGHDVHIIEAFSGRRRDLDWYIPFLNPHCIAEKKLEFDQAKYSDNQLKLIEKLLTWRKPTAYFGEAAHFQKHMPANRSVADELIKYGIHLLYNKYAMSHEVRRNATSMILPRCFFNQESAYVMELYDAIGASRFSSRTGASREALLKPVHDPEIADYRSAFENGMVNVSRVFRHQRDGISRDEKGRVDPMTSAIAKYLKV